MSKKGGKEKILLAHGGGGRLNNELLHRLILPALHNKTLADLGDSAQLELPTGSICFTTDSYVVKPLFFPGGDIGKLAVCGTVNDLAVAGCKPIAISLALIIEEGLEFETLEKILKSIKHAAQKNNVAVVTGDTKTVEVGAANKIFINTAGIGLNLPQADLGLGKIRSGDKIIINGPIGEHGMTVISQREAMQFQSELKSDCAGLAGLTATMLRKTNGIKFMRDATRGGLAAILNEISTGSGLGVEIQEDNIPVTASVQAAADMLGFDVLTIANEGKVVAVVSSDAAEKCLNLCRNHPLGKKAKIIGRITEKSSNAMVEMITKIGGRRIVQMPYGRELPRIC